MQSTPAPSTLARYGLSESDWVWFWSSTRGVCPICGKETRLVIDHQHEPGWRDKPPEKRRLAVRGLLCAYCNWKFLPRNATPEKLRNAADYLQAYLDRRADEQE